MSKFDIEISEVGPRDGLQSIKAIMPTDAKKAWIKAEYEAGVPEIEVGSFVSVDVGVEKGQTPLDLIDEHKRPLRRPSESQVSGFSPSISSLYPVGPLPSLLLWTSTSEAPSFSHSLKIELLFTALSATHLVAQSVSIVETTSVSSKWPASFKTLPSGWTILLLPCDCDALFRFSASAGRKSHDRR